MKRKPKLMFTRDEMYEMSVKLLKKRGVSIEAIAEITYAQQAKYNPQLSMSDCIESVEKILSLRDPFHYILLAVELDILAEERKLSKPLQDILEYDLGMFGIDEVMGLDVAGMYGTIGQTNFGDIDVNKPGIVGRLNSAGKEKGVCHTFLDDIVGAIAAAASTRVAQIISEDEAKLNKKKGYTQINLFDKK